MGDYLMSLIKANDIQNASGGIPTVKSQQLIPTARVRFNGTGTVAIKDAENVSSISDLGTGIYRVNFAVNMANTNYCIQGSNIGSLAPNYYSFIAANNAAPLVTGIAVQVIRYDAVISDMSHVNVTVMGGQA